MNSIELQRKEKTAQLAWTGFILFFFLIQAIIWIIAISITANDSSHAVVSGYDQRALQWDQSRAVQLASEALGWEAQLLVDQTSDIHGNRIVNLKVHDRQDSPVEQAEAELQAFHCGRASEVQQIALQEIGSGVYSGQVQIRRPGNWQFVGTLVRGDEKFVFNERQHVDVAGRP